MVTWLFFVVLFLIIFKYLFFFDKANTLLVNFLMAGLIYFYGILKIIDKSKNYLNFRDIDYYYYYYKIVSLESFSNYMGIHPKEYGFWHLNYILGLISNLTEVQYTIILFTLMSALYLVGIFIATKSKFIDIYYLTILIFTETSNGFINTVRQGFAIGILLIAYALILRKWNKSGFIVSLGAYLFHSSAIIYPVNLLGTRVFKKVSLKYFWMLCVFTFFLSMTHLNQVIFGTIGANFNDNYSDYVSSTSYGDSAYTVFPIITFFYGIVINFLKNYTDSDSTERIDTLLKIYLLAASVFFCFSFIAFSDRIGKYAWTMVPLILVYIVSHLHTKNDSKKLILVAIPVFFTILSYLMNSGSYFVQ